MNFNQREMFATLLLKAYCLLALLALLYYIWGY